MRYAVGGLADLAAHRGGHREHQLLRDHRARPLRADALRTPAGRGAAVLPEPDGAPRTRRRRGAGARFPTARARCSRCSTASPRASSSGSTARRSTPPTPSHCAQVGAALARLHVASQSYRARLTNRRGPAWWRQAARAVKPHLPPAQAALLDAEIKFQTGFGRVKLAKGAIHGDLFCDNVLFDGDRVAGIIDFGFAATDFFAYDLAITVNDWCVDADGAPRSTRSPLRWSRRTTRCVRSARTSGTPGRRSCAPPRCASGCRACTTSTCRGRASSRMRTIRRISSASCALACRRTARWPLPARNPMSDVPREFVFTRYPARHGMVVAAHRVRDVQAASRAWVMLVLGYFIDSDVDAPVPLRRAVRDDRS